MAAPAAQAVTMSESVTAIVVKAGEDIASGLIDRGFAWVDGNPSAAGILLGIGVGLVVARMGLPRLQRWAAGTETKIDDRIVAVLRWVVGAVAGRVEDRKDK